MAPFSIKCARKKYRRCSFSFVAREILRERPFGEMITLAMRCLCVILLATTILAADNLNETATTTSSAANNVTATPVSAKPTSQCFVGYFRCTSGLCISHDAVCDSYSVRIHPFLLRPSHALHRTVRAETTRKTAKSYTNVTPNSSDAYRQTCAYTNRGYATALKTAVTRV